MVQVHLARTYYALSGLIDFNGSATVSFCNWSFSHAFAALGQSFNDYHREMTGPTIPDFLPFETADFFGHRRSSSNILLILQWNLLSPRV